MAKIDDIETHIKQEINVEEIRIKDLSKRHEGHMGYIEGEVTHIQLEVVSQEFKKMSTLQKQRRMNDILRPFLEDKLHSVVYKKLIDNTLV